MSNLIPTSMLTKKMVPLELPYANMEKPSLALPHGKGPIRTSDYTILCDLEEDNGSVLLVHSYTGAINRVSSKVATYLRALIPRKSRRAISTVAPPDAVVKQLLQRGHLTTMSVEQEVDYFARVANRVHMTRGAGTPSYIFMLTYDCNLRCTYCYQNDLRVGDQRLQNIDSGMSIDMVDRWWRAMDQIDSAHNSDSTQRRITLYGGEPLLARHRPVLSHILKRATEDNVALSAISNGTELDQCADFIGPDKISRIQITLDGPPEMHDQRRINADGSGSFKETARGISLALSLGANVDVRINVDRDNIDFLPELTKVFNEEGWINNNKFSCYVAAVHKSTSAVKSERPMSSWHLKKALADLTADNPEVARVSTQDYTIAGALRTLLRGGDPLSAFSTAYCGAQTSMYVFDPVGDIYACWERTGDKTLRAGMLDSDGVVLMNSTLKRWRGRNTTTNETCAKCSYASFCGGGCAAVAEEKTGDLLSPFCDGFQRRFRMTAKQVFDQHLAGHKAQEIDRVKC